MNTVRSDFLHYLSVPRDSTKISRLSEGENKGEKTGVDVHGTDYKDHFQIRFIPMPIVCVLSERKGLLFYFDPLDSFRIYFFLLLLPNCIAVF